MCIQSEFSAGNGRSCRRLLYRQKRQRTVLPCLVCSSTLCHQICTILEPKCPRQVSGRATHLWMQDNPMLIQGIRLACPKSGPKHHRLLDNLVHTSFFYRKRICPSYTRRRCNPFLMVVYLNQNSIYCPSTAPKTGAWNFIKALGYRSLFVVIVRVHYIKPCMFVDGIHNIPIAVNCVGVTKAVGGHYIIHGPTSESTSGACEADIRGNRSIWYAALSSLLTKQGGETFESFVFHSICPTKVDISEFVLNVLNWPTFALSKGPSWDGSSVCHSSSQSAAFYRHLNNESSYICNDICNWCWMF